MVAWELERSSSYSDLADHPKHTLPIGGNLSSLFSCDVVNRQTDRQTDYEGIGL